ncbi:MAG: ATP-binding protein [Capsulimonadaceae bacterium]|nr:ATP-binding protein [Capsulimonadaceae bacterium]
MHGDIGLSAHPLLAIAASSFLMALALGMFDLLRSSRRETNREKEFAELLLTLDGKVQECEQLGAQWRTLLEAVPDPVFLIDHTGGCHAANVSAERLFPVGEHHTVLSLTQSAELDALYQEARQADSHPSVKPQPVKGEINLHYPQERVMEVSIHPISGEPVQPASDQPAFIAILRDRTDLRRLELVRRDFVANVSHELRTPLSSVKAMAETLIDGALHDPDVAQHFLETIIRESDRLVRLSADLLDLSRVESRPVTKTPNDLGELAIEVSGRLAAQAREAGIALTVDVNPPLVATCDSDEIAQVLVNLLDNAIKYTTRGGSVTVRAEEDNGEIILAISDTGIGILRQDLPRLFERFYRADKARSRASGGTGLGLAIVKHIVERHGGRVWVESEYNKGSTFFFAVPK